MLPAFFRACARCQAGGVPRHPAAAGDAGAPDPARGYRADPGRGGAICSAPSNRSAVGRPSRRVRRPRGGPVCLHPAGHRASDRRPGQAEDAVPRIGVLESGGTGRGRRARRGRGGPRVSLRASVRMREDVEVASDESVRRDDLPDAGTADEDAGRAEPFGVPDRHSASLLSQCVGAGTKATSAACPCPVRGRPRVLPADREGHHHDFRNLSREGRLPERGVPEENRVATAAEAMPSSLTSTGDQRKTAPKAVSGGWAKRSASIPRAPPPFRNSGFPAPRADRGRRGKCRTSAPRTA